MLDQPSSAVMQCKKVACPQASGEYGLEGKQDASKDDSVQAG